MTAVTVTPMEPGYFGVQVEEGDVTTSHRVRVPDDFLEDLGLSDVDPVRVIDESFEFLLEREPTTSILSEFSLEAIPEHFPEYYDELKSRLTA
jgi:hypothetical protein